MPSEQINWQILTQTVPEVTPGTAIAATHQLAGLALADGAHMDTMQNSPQGHAYVTSSNRGKGWGELKPVGDADFNSLVYPLSSLFGGATITTAAGGVTSKQWKWTPPIINTVLGQTYTVERGQTAGRARKFAYVTFDALKLGYTKSDVTIDGHAWAREMTEGITLTSLAASTIVSAFPVRGTDTSLYIDPTSGAVGTTQMTRVGAMDVNFSNYFIPWYGIDSSQTSFSVLLPAKPKVDVTFRLMSDVNGMAVYNTYLQTGATAYVRFNTVGPVSDGTAHFSVILDMALKITGPQDFTDDGGAEVIPFTAVLAEDSAWGTGTACIMTVINMIAAL
jgi:hypothetical protein